MGARGEGGTQMGRFSLKIAMTYIKEAMFL